MTHEENMTETGDVVAPPETSEALDAKIEAILFASEVPLPAKRLAELAVSRSSKVLEAIDRLNVFYSETGRAFRVTPIAGGFQLATTPEHGALLTKLHRDRVPTRLSRAALETLSIIAFKQPATRAEIDMIRGVSASDGVLRHLLDRKLVRISGRAEAPGRPLLYATTPEFLAYFGLPSLSELPRSEELNSLLSGDLPPGMDQEAELADAEFPHSVPEPVIMEAGPEPSAAGARTTPVSHSGEESDDHGGAASP
jgi:segregation and condensation protein B